MRLTPRARSLGGQASWSILDQAASSLGTFVLAIAVARTSDLSGFGAFAIAFTIYTLTLTGSRALLTMPYMMAASKEAPGDGRSLASGALGAVILLCALVLAALGLAGLLLGDPLRIYLLVLAVGVPALLLQDAYRYVLLHIYGTRSVTVIDAGWTALQIVLSLIVVITVTDATGIWHMAAWLVAAAAAACYGWRRTGIGPHVGEGWRFVRRTHRTGVPLLVEGFAISGSGAAASFAVATAGGLAALAPLRGAAVVLGPVSVATGGLLFLATPIVLRTGTGDRGRLLRRCALFGTVISVVCLVTALLVLVAPTELGVTLLGQVWVESRPVVFPVALAIALYAFETSAMLGFRAHHLTRPTMVLRLFIFPVPALAALAGLALGGPAGAAYGMAAAALLTAAALWWMLARLPASQFDSAVDPAEVRG